MKAIVERLNKTPKSSFVLQKDSFKFYPTPWHYHPEYELVLVLKSTGKKIIGDNISNFNDGDLVFIGPNLPHVYNNDQEYYDENSKLRAEAIVIHFTEDFLGEDFFNIPEMEPIKKFLQSSISGYSIQGKTRKTIEQRMKKMLKISNPLKIIELLSILELLAETKEKVRLSTPGFTQDFKMSGSERITKVCDFIMKNFSSEIALNQVAEIANMSPNAFCHFFKQRTRKSFVSFLNEIRVGYACKLLSEERLNISEISYKSGFQNLSNFNRQFKKYMNKTPNEFRKDVAGIL